MKRTVRKISRGFRTLVKIIFRAIAFLILLAVFIVATAALIVQHMISSEDLKAIITTQLQEVFHRPVQIQGVKFNIYQGIRIQGFQVLESPDFAGGNFLTSDYLLAKYKWKALLHKHLEFEQIQIVAPRIQLVRRDDGRWNWEDILKSSGTHHSELDVAQFSLPVDLFAHVISIEDGVVTVKDHPRDRQYSMQSLDLIVQDFDLDRPFSLTASFENDHMFLDHPVHSAVALEGNISLAGLHLDQAVFRAETMEIKTGGKILRASLSVKDFEHPKIDAALRLPHLDSDFLSQYRSVPRDLSIPPSRWRARFSFPEEKQFQLDSLTGTAGDMKLQANGFLGFSKESKPFRLAWAFPPVSLEEVTAVWGFLGQYGLSGRASVSGELVGDLADLDHTLAVQKLELSLQDFGGSFFMNHKLTHVDARLSGTRNLENLSVAIERGTLMTYGNILSRINFLADLRRGNLEFKRFNGNWDASHFELNGWIRRLRAPTEIHVDGSIDRIRLDPAITAFLDLLDRLKSNRPAFQTTRAEQLWSQVFKYSIPKTFPATSGDIKVGEVSYPNFQTFKLEAQWDLRGISTGLNQANGDIRIGFGPGRVADIQALQDQDSHSILKVIFLPFVFMHKMNNLSVISTATAYPKSMDFNRIYGDYGLGRGVVNVRLFHVDSAELLASAEGTVDFPKEKVDLHILTRLTHSRGPLPEYLTDEQGRPSIGFFVTDDLNKPTLKIEYRKMSSDAIEKALQSGLERGKKIFSRIKEAL